MIPLESSTVVLGAAPVLAEAVPTVAAGRRVPTGRTIMGGVGGRPGFAGSVTWWFAPEGRRARAAATCRPAGEREEAERKPSPSESLRVKRKQKHLW
ncbi:hypothetical protein GCM10010271_29170 [Streptomyces kurssanovii]|nr:hypothetical protein GCM10010271_29170 [Streptomyces kurssanovii]